MSILKNSADIFDLRLGATGAAEAYLGDVLVWPIAGCGVTLHIPFGSADDPTELIDKSRPRKTIADSTGVTLVTAAGATNGVAGDFTAGGNLLIRYPFACDFLTRPFTIECNVKITSQDDVINLFERGTYSLPLLYSYYSIKLHSTHIAVFNDNLDIEDSSALCNVKLFFPQSTPELTPGIWYRVVVQRDLDGRFTVYLNGVPGTTYRPIFGNVLVDQFHDSLEYTTGQFFYTGSFIGVGKLAKRIDSGINNTNHVTNQLYVGGAGYIDDYKVTVCTPPVANIPRIPAPGADPYYGNVALLMHFNEITEQKFVDSGPLGLEPEIVGAPSIGLTTLSGTTNNLAGVGPLVGRFGVGSGNAYEGKALIFSAGADTETFNDVFNLGANDQNFTVEFWAKTVGGSSNPGGPVMGYYVTYPTNGSYPRPYVGWSIGLGSYHCSQGCGSASFGFEAIAPGPPYDSNPGKNYFYGGTGTIEDIAVCNNCDEWLTRVVTSPDASQGVYSNYQVFHGEWHHYAVTRSGDIIRLFLDGHVVAYGPVAFNFSTGVAKDAKAGFKNPNNPNEFLVPPKDDFIAPVLMLGARIKDFPAGAIVELDEVRITAGVARYTEDFALQSRAFPDM